MKPFLICIVLLVGSFANANVNCSMEGFSSNITVSLSSQNENFKLVKSNFSGAKQTTILNVEGYVEDNLGYTYSGIAETKLGKKIERKNFELNLSKIAHARSTLSFSDRSSINFRCY